MPILRPLQLLFACSLGIAASASASVHYYRFYLLSKFPDPVFHGEIPDGTEKPQDYFSVEKDALNRFVRTGFFVRGKEVRTLIYLYEGDARRPRSVMFKAGDALRVQATITYNSDGLEARTDMVDNSGKLESTTTHEYFKDHAVRVEIDASHREISREWLYYNDAGLVIERHGFVPGNPDARMLDLIFSPETGRVIRSVQYGKNVEVGHSEFFFNAEGRLLHHEGYSANGVHYLTDLYADELRRRRTYFIEDRNTEELDYDYNDNRDLVATRLKYNGKPVCAVTYVRSSSGHVDQSVITGIDGQVWAEYKGVEVMDFSPDGSLLPPQPEITTLHKPGPWW
ncbi:MAG TPA: hypothetical protein VHD32_12925 [Candidatus Didemnitutus sp.]|nr:hypothetical protein [Candidatus Didemnitutus sp.]